METEPLDALDQRRLLHIAIVCIGVLVVLVGIISWLVWNVPDPLIAYVPLPILEWAFIGGMVAVLCRLAYQRNTPDIRLYIWVVTKPIIGLVMGSLVYFIAVGGSILLGGSIIGSHGQPQDPNRIRWLNALAFIGGFSDRFSIDLINKVVSGYRTGKSDKTSIN